MSKPKGPYSPPYPLVEIVWNDAASNPTTWVQLEEIEGHEQVRSVGFLVKDAPDFVALAGSVSNEDIEDETVGNTISIPRGMVVTMRTIRQGSTAKKAKKAKRSGSKPVGPKPDDGAPEVRKAT